MSILICGRSKITQIRYKLSKMDLQFSILFKSQPMAQQFIKDYYLKLKLIRHTEIKQIWLVKNTLDSETAVAKLQHTFDHVKKYTRTVLHQGKFMQVMQGHLGIPFLHWAGKEESKGISIIIVQKLGDTLEDKLEQIGGKFSLKTVCQLGISMLKIVQGYHQKGYVVGNIKMNSFQLGTGSKCNELYINDLMQSASYVKKGKHIAKEMAKQKTPIHQFMSFSRMAGFEASRKDDVQSIILLLVYFLKGKLPWTRLFEKYSQKQKLVESEQLFDSKDVSMSKEETKEETLKFHKKLKAFEESHTEKLKCITRVQESTTDQICQGIGEEFKSMLRKCREWEFEERPDYNFMIRALKRVMARHRLQQDGIFDWSENERAVKLIRQKNLQSLKLEVPNEKQILKNCYQPFCQKIEIS